MATIKSFTDLSQSKKLTEILPIESADMCYSNDGTAIKIDANPYTVRYSMWKDCVVELTPCWSLTALLSVLPLIDFTRPLLIGTSKTLYKCMYNDDLKSHAYDNPIDACVAMIEKLHELKKL